MRKSAYELSGPSIFEKGYQPPAVVTKSRQSGMTTMLMDNILTLAAQSHDEQLSSRMGMSGSVGVLCRCPGCRIRRLIEDAMRSES